jgi:hypothetical protein
MKNKEYFFGLFKTQKARDLARSIDDYLYFKSPYCTEVEDYHESRKNGQRTDCIGYISKKGLYKFVSLTTARKTCLVLHLGKKLHTNTAIEMQEKIDLMLNKKYKDSDPIKLTPGEVYIRLEWVENLDQIIPFIDEAYYFRLEMAVSK